VNYNGTSAQTVYNTADAAFLKSTPTNYGNLSFTNSGTKTLNAGALTVGGNLINNTGSILNGNAAANTATITGTTSNIGTINVNAENITFTGAVTNSGTYTGGAGTSAFSNGVTNSGTFTGGTGSITITAGTGTLTNNSGGTVTGGAGTMTIATLTNNNIVNGGAGPMAITNLTNNSTGIVTGSTGTITIATLANNSGSINGSSTTGGITVTGTSSNAGTVNVNKGTMLFGGVLTNTGTYTGGTGTSTFTAGLTNSLIVTESTGQFTIGNLINNSPGTFTGNSAAATTSVTGTLTNSGTITVNAENITVAGASSNSGTYTGGAGTSTFTTGLINTGTVNEGAGTFTLGDLTNTSPGIFNGNPTTAATSAIGTMTNTGTITVGFENMTFSGAAVNSGTYTGGAPGISTFNGSFTNSGSGTFAAGTADVNFNGNYTNSATFTGNATGKIIFGGAGSQTLTDNSTNGTVMINPFVQGSGIKSMTGSKGFFVASTGILTMAGIATLDGGGALTLNSDANSAATLAYVPPGCSITGNVNVQRFIQGNNDINKRGYRLLSSSVYNGIDAASGNAHVYSLQYLTNSVYVSGAGALASGFNVTTTQNPSLYLFREDLAPPPSSTTMFTTGYNWKGVAKINNTPAYNIGTQAKNTTSNINDATVTIPVGNGLLFFFRGDNQTPANLAFPAGAPQDVTLTQTGTPNTGTVNVRLWYADATNNLGNNLSYTAATDVGSLALKGGYALVGNPYPSTINWEKYNANATVANSSIYGGGGLNSKIYVFNPTNKQYEAYIPTGIDTVSVNPAFSTAQGQASNMIASGQGFFIKADAAGETLSFREGAKTSTQPLAASLNKLMGTPKAFATAPNPLLRLKMSKDSINTDEIVIRLNSQSSTKFGDNKDAEDLDGSGALVSLSAFSSDSIRVSIYSTSYPGLQQQVIPLSVNATATGLYKLDRTQLDNLPALYEVWLKDAFMNDSLDMKANATYQFNIDKTNPATFGKNRFTLVIRQNSALAYQLLDFTGSKVGNSLHAQLVWNTLNEQNYVNFTVERSNDGGKTFGVVGGLQSTGAGNYSMVDKNAVKGLNLYRLKQEDINNTITYSNIVQLIFDDKGKGNDGKLSIYPNPAANNINLAVAAESNGNNTYIIQFTSSSGLVVKQITASQPAWQGNISNLQPGTYLVRVINNKTQNLVGENKFVKL
jgi:hypothetical protein